jgi:hypothetical protein
MKIAEPTRGSEAVSLPRVIPDIFQVLLVVSYVIL